MGSLFYQAIYSLVVLTLISCGIGKDDNEATKSLNSSCAPEPSAELLTGFENTVYPIIQTKCAACHGSSQSPLFAFGDSANSLSISLGLMSGSPSRFEIKAGDSHCGANCSNNAAMKAALDGYKTFVATLPQPSCANSNENAGGNEVVPDTTTGQGVYDTYCMSCHRLGAYDPSGSPNLSGKGGDVSDKFQAGVKGHKNITLSAQQIANLKTFINAH